MTGPADRPQFQQFPPDFEGICEDYARLEHWSLGESACLLSGFDPDRPRNFFPEHEDWDGRLDRTEREIERSQPGVKAVAGHGYLQAKEVVKWGLATYDRIPRLLAAAMGYQVPVEGGAWVYRSEVAPEHVRPNKAAQEAMRDFARQLWEQNPELKAADIVERKDIPKGAKHYGVESRKRWIKDLNPTPKHQRGGRRRKKGS